MAFIANSTDDARVRRKMNKPLVEKRRRERINKYLYELHDLLQETDKSTPSNKVEKADILEMAVKHIRNLKQRLRVKVLECGDNAMSLEQMDRLGLLQQDPPVTQNLQIRIPSPSVSPVNSNGSTGYPSPTPSLPNGAQFTQKLIPIHSGMALLHVLPQRVDNSHQAYMNRHNMYTMPCQAYTPRQSVSMPSHQLRRDIALHKKNVTPANMWRPW